MPRTGNTRRPSRKRRRSVAAASEPPAPAARGAPANAPGAARLALPHRIALLLIAVGALLICSNLGNRYLWDDEAETALLARSVLVHGIPTAFDGKNLVSQELGLDSDSSFVWRWTPWLPQYLAAGSFALFGEGTLSARLPFALLGLLSLASMYALARRVFHEPWTAVLALAFLVFSVPFLLYVRQCRYYSPAIFGAIWSLYFLFGLIEGRRRAAIGFVAAATVVFHSNYVIFVDSLIALTLCLPWFFPRRAVLLRVAGSFVGATLLNLPWILFFDFLGKAGETERVHSIAECLGKYYFGINQFALPLLALLPFLLALAWRRARRLPLGPASARPFLFLVAFALVFVGLVSLLPWSFFRYLIGLLPVFALLSAFICRSVWSWSPAAGLLATPLLLFTGVLHTASAAVAARYEPLHKQIVAAEQTRRINVVFPLYNYLHEITHDFDGPIERLVLLLRERARQGDRVFISYGDLPLKFYTDYEIKGGLTGEDLASWTMPDWIVLRSFFRFGDRPAMKLDSYRMQDYLRSLPGAAYTDVEAGIVDTYWENIPEPALHRYRTPVAGPHVRVLERLR